MKIERTTYNHHYLPDVPDFVEIPPDVASKLLFEVPTWASTAATTPEDVLADKQARRVIFAQIDTLRMRESEIVRRFLFGDNFKEIAKDYGISGGRIQQIFWHAINKLRHAFHLVPIRTAWRLVPDPRPPKPPVEPFRPDYFYECGPVPLPIQYPRELPENYRKILAVLATTTDLEQTEIRDYRNLKNNWQTAHLEIRMPPKLARMERLQKKLTPAEDRQVRDFIGRCRLCEGVAGIYGYCYGHHKQIIQFPEYVQLAHHLRRSEAFKKYYETFKRGLSLGKNIDAKLKNKKRRFKNVTGRPLTRK